MADKEKMSKRNPFPEGFRGKDGVILINTEKLKSEEELGGMKHSGQVSEKKKRKRGPLLQETGPDSTITLKKEVYRGNETN